MTEKVTLELARRSAMSLILAGLASGASRADACSMSGPVTQRDEIVGAFVALSTGRDADRIGALLTDDFTFHPNLDDKPLNRDGFLAWLRASRSPNKEGIRAELIDAGVTQVVQREYVRFEDSPSPPTSCGNLGNYSLRIAVYDLIGYGDTTFLPCPPSLAGSSSNKPCPPDPTSGPFHGTQIARLHHISLPFSRGG